MTLKLMLLLVPCWLAGCSVLGEPSRVSVPGMSLDEVRANEGPWSFVTETDGPGEIRYHWAMGGLYGVCYKHAIVRLVVTRFPKPPIGETLTIRPTLVRMEYDTTGATWDRLMRGGNFR